MSEKFITKEEVVARTAIKPRTLRGMVQRGLFPTPVKISPQRIAYVESEVEMWMADRISEAGKPVPDQRTFCDDEY